MESDRTFEAFPQRSLRLSNETWEELKKAKANSQKTWNQFVKELLTNIKL